ncbi:MAG TPA: aminoglycoside phosphotransferase family protein [Galbitalea sp.]
MKCEPFEDAPIETYGSLSAWGAEAPGIVGRMLTRWQLSPGDVFVGGISASVLSVRTREGIPAVLKVGYPHVEARWEAVGLAAFPRDAAPAVLRQDPWTWAMLLEPIYPGTPLNQVELDPREGLRVGGALHARLTASVVPDGIPTLVTAMADYARTARDRLPAQERQLDALGVRELVGVAVDELEELADTGASSTLLHGDFNPGNILLGADGRWQTIDPKPLVGDPAYDLWPLVSQLGRPYESAHPATVLAEQLAIAADAAEVDPGRAARWAFARTGLNVSWYLADGLPAEAAKESEGLKAWATVIGL